MSSNSPQSEEAVKLENEAEFNDFLSRSFLELEKLDENLYRSRNMWKYKYARGVYGGQLIGQALSAAAADVSKEKHIHSLHSYFLNKGDSGAPVVYYVDKVREGRTYAVRSVKATQVGQQIFTMQVSFKSSEPYKRTHQLVMPKVPHPDEVQTTGEILFDLKENNAISNKAYQHGIEWTESFPVLAKWIDPNYFMRHTPVYPKRALWMKALGHIGEQLHPNIHKCCLAYMSDWAILQTSLLPYGRLHKKSAFITSLDHSMWFHAPCRADEWLLYEIESDSIGDGRSLSHGRIWDMQGNLVTTVSQEGVLRHEADRIDAKL